VTGGKHVVAVVEPGPDYSFHLLAVARVGFAGEYAERHRATVSAADRRCLEEHAALLAFGDGRRGKLTSLLVFLPAYLNLDAEVLFGGVLRARGCRPARWGVAAHARTL